MKMYRISRKLYMNKMEISMKRLKNKKSKSQVILKMKTIITIMKMSLQKLEDTGTLQGNSKFLILEGKIIIGKEFHVLEEKSGA